MLKHQGTKTIQTSRLILRKACMADAEPMFRNWASDPEVTRYLTWPPHGDLAVSQRVLTGWITESEKPDYYQWLIVWKELGQPIGSISVVRLQEETGEAEVGYCIGKAWWHRGIMTEALEAVLRFLMQEVGFSRVVARHDVRNPHSGAVMKKCGMVYEGTALRSDRNNQGLCDICTYALEKKG